MYADRFVSSLKHFTVPPSFDAGVVLLSVIQPPRIPSHPTYVHVLYRSKPMCPLQYPLLQRSVHVEFLTVSPSPFHRICPHLHTRSYTSRIRARAVGREYLDFKTLISMLSIGFHVHGFIFTSRAE